MFLIIVIIVLSLLHGYVGARMIAPFALAGPSLLIYWSIIIVLAITPVSGIILRVKGIENSFTDILLWIGYTSLGLFTLALAFFFIRDVIWLFGLIAGKLFILFNGDYKGSVGVDHDRRQFLLMSVNLGIAGVTGVFGAMGFIQARNRPKIFNVDIQLSRLPQKLQGLKIVQISDLHIGPTIKKDYVQGVVNQVNELNPDLIFFTGDMVDGSVEYLSEDVEPLRNLKAKYGKFFVTGNHEYYSGVEFWEEKVSELGMTNLRNEHQILEIAGEKLAIAGVTDLKAHQVMKSHQSDPTQAVQGIPDNIPTIMLAHQPGSAHAAENLNVDLMLCGHTHGGQYFPFHYAVAKAHPYIAGLYQHEDMQVYVNQGTGYWGPPLRLGIPSEITLLELVPEKVHSVS